MSEKPDFPNVDEITTSVAELQSNPTLKQEVFDMLCSNWSPARVSRHLFRTKGVKLTPSAIRTFLDEIPPAFVLPPSFIKTKLLQLDVIVDSVGELGRMLKVQEERVSAALLLEDITPGGAKGNSITIEATRLIEKYEKSLHAYTTLMQSIGELPEEPMKVDLTSGGEGLPTLRQIFEEKDERASELETRR